MSKKGMGRLVVLAAVAGAAAAGVSYLTRYHSFNRELDEDFHDFEDEEAKLWELQAYRGMVRPN